jgi:hypothetical protein
VAGVTRLSIGLAAAAAILLAGPVSAGIYKCPGPDGKIVFTSDPTACPGAKPHVLKKQVQNVLEDHNARSRQRSTRPAARRSLARGDGIEKMWRRKRPTGERDLAQAERRLARMRNVIKACNRGGEWYRTDESGIRSHIPCSELQSKMANAQKKRDDLVSYLDEGLEDECRRAGCQPGWIR